VKGKQWGRPSKGTTKWKESEPAMTSQRKKPRGTSVKTKVPKQSKDDGSLGGKSKQKSRQWRVVKGKERKEKCQSQGKQKYQKNSRKKKRTQIETNK